jgi:tRNA threonylcarbamoyladenosine biosynthesis protein TsaB
VAQGLALGANLKVIPVDSLKAVAEDARQALLDAQDTEPFNPLEDVHIASVMDARMSEVYVGVYRWQAASAQWTSVQPLQVGAPEAMAAQLSQLSQLSQLGLSRLVLAGNGFDVYKERFSLQELKNSVHLRCVAAVPHALALLRMAPALWLSEQAVAPEWVQPLYIRDKVAQTTAERDAIKLAKASASTISTSLPPT